MESLPTPYFYEEIIKMLYFKLGIFKLGSTVAFDQYLHVFLKVNKK